jgi:hypothetical protein
VDIFRCLHASLKGTCSGNINTKLLELDFLIYLPSLAFIVILFMSYILAGGNKK